ncbi:MAG: adenylate/guanylate cyclase domain-containing protein [Candidatus Auribacterota bacterium]
MKPKNFIPHIIRSYMHRRPFRVDILSAFGIILVVTVTSIIWYSNMKGSQAIMELMDNMMSSVSKIVIERTENYLLPASLMTSVIAQVAGPVDFKQILDQDKLEEYMIQVLRGYPQLCRFNFGDQYGNFLMVKDFPDGTFGTEIINRTDPEPYLVWKYRNADGNIIKTTKSSTFDYDPRSRPWYIGASENKEQYWTEVYLFHSDKRPGISSSYPVFDKNGDVFGVFAIDIELDKILEFLQEHPISRFGTVFIVDEHDQVVAYPDLSFLVTKTESDFALVAVDELDGTIIKETFMVHRRSGKSKFFFKYDGTDYVGSITPFPAEFGNNWRIGILVETDLFVGPLHTAAYVVSAISFIILIIALLIASLISRSISRPIMILTEETKKIKNLYLDEKINLKSHILEIQLIRDALSVMKTSLQAFNKYVPSALVRQLIETGEEARIGGQNKELTIFFSDIEGFTSLSETVDADTLFIHISEYFEALSKIVTEQRGTVDKYIGDAIMAFWGAPVQDDQHAYFACKTALLCHRKVQELNRKWKQEGKPPLPTRFGIHTGQTVVGNVGSTERMNYSVMGDSVNLASRLERINIVYGTHIIVSENTYFQARDRFVFKKLGSVKVKGKSSELMVYELVAEKDEHLAPEIEAFCNEFNDAVDLYSSHKLKDAFALFKVLHDRYPEDQSISFFMKRCQTGMF